MHGALSENSEKTWNEVTHNTLVCKPLDDISDEFTIHHRQTECESREQSCGEEERKRFHQLQVRGRDDKVFRFIIHPQPICFWRTAGLTPSFWGSMNDHLSSPPKGS
ncbi:hypothetical protein ACH5RR_021932 [Cinchona calisaya]|uniref:Uncharacterized protein n=1 Tax=Cinchona calisaya TaxID=153742 RepID=A0ABD2Z6F5_9GENT